MRLKFAASMTCLSVLACFLTWAIHWTLEDRSQVTFGLEGSATTLMVSADPEARDLEVVNDSAQRLRRFLDVERLPLITASAGDGLPGLVVHDVGSRVPWFTPPPVEPTDLQAGSPVYALTGTYTEKQWRHQRTNGLVPEQFTVVGVVPAPPSSEHLQFARPLDDKPLSSGTFVVGTVQPRQIADLGDLLAGQNLIISTQQTVSTVSYLRHDAFVSTTAILLVLGILCSVIFWSSLLGDRRQEVLIRRRHGATRRRITAQWVVAIVPSAAAAAVIGAGTTGIAVWAGGHRSLNASETSTVLLGTALGLGTTMIVWCIAVTASLRVRVRGPNDLVG